MNQLRSQSPLDRSRRTRSVTEMRTATLTGFLVFAASAACSFDPPADREEDASTADVDAVVPDAIPVDCEPDTIVCDDAAERYVECDSTGTPSRVIDCALGCSDGVEKCIDVAPSNGLAGYLDLARDDDAATDVVFTGSSTINTDTGEVTIGGVATAVPTDVANGIRVYMFKSVEIPGTVKVTGAIPLALVSDGNVSITGTLDVSADASTRGPGSSVETAACVGGSDSNFSSNPIPGGGGGGRFQAGAAGGAGYNGPAGRPGGVVASDPDLEPLVGGCRGGTAAYILIPTPPPNGGAGGGAVQITSRTRIEVVASGKIDASGGGGAGPGPGPGGGSGGGVLLEAPDIVIDGIGAVISTKGGAGGGARGSGTGAPGADGGTGPAAAAGGSLGGYAIGGNGGTEAAAPTNGGSGNSTNIHGAGGGGSVGEARFNTATATVLPTNGAAIRSRFSTGTIGTRLVP